MVESTRDQVRAYVATQLGSKPEKLEESRTVLSYIDSLRQLEVIDEVETHFGIELDETELFRVESVRDFIDVVTERLSRRGA